MLGINELKIGICFKFNNQPYIVLEANHLKMGRGGAVLQTKIKNLINNSVLNRTFKPSDKFPEVELEKINASFLYNDQDNLYLMNNENYEQVSLSKKEFISKLPFLREQLEIKIIYFENQPIDIELPKKVVLKIVSAPPAIRGDTVQGNVSKKAKLETNFEIAVPLFIKEGDLIKINTETGKYVERVNK